ncbi:hypothetical protein A2415_02875 [candidate division WWE3 bacterium RIFOXYC1_FULL_39_7]|uniref:Uncharacterized protein n=2 Tax=Katanobacteria TaxID=422282 RepID=A0A1F4X634_UNCKA|nr:MAG: hypothetical protein A2415_02875 [candidate division WWE3 bacterium RIFOXYC1_FULL_39_7]OGC77126.1 MAG: hypothetical protein A2619_00400 [candidate division WWE3 bacterium RIFOXYD1_FULL_39_9]
MILEQNIDELKRLMKSLNFFINRMLSELRVILLQLDLLVGVNLILLCNIGSFTGFGADKPHNISISLFLCHVKQYIIKSTKFQHYDEKIRF